MKRKEELTQLVSGFTEHLRSRRRALGLTQEQLAERTGFSANYIARLEVGMSVPSLATLVRLAKALQVKVADLLTGEFQAVSPNNVCTTILSPLSDEETKQALLLLKSAVDMILALRNN
jgi:transcriptional regulator with XRE-family HTH domain